MLHRLRGSVRCELRRLIGLLLLVSLCASLGPVPVAPTPSAGQGGSVPYPCRHRGCGCRSAAQCWRGCCCFTNREKVAWARQQGLAPPAYVVAAARKESASKTPLRSCCSASTSPADEATVASSAEAVSGQDAHTPAATRPEDSTAEHTRANILVIGVRRQQCQGEGISWSWIPWGYLAQSAPECPLPTPRGWEFIGSAIVKEQAGSPPEPPPRIAVGDRTTV